MKKLIYLIPALSLVSCTTPTAERGRPSPSNSTNSLSPGVYYSEPYSGIVVIPENKDQGIAYCPSNSPNINTVIPELKLKKR